MGKRLPTPIVSHEILRKKIHVNGRKNRRKRRRQGEITLAKPGG